MKKVCTNEIGWKRNVTGDGKHNQVMMAKGWELGKVGIRVRMYKYTKVDLDYPLYKYDSKISS